MKKTYYSERTGSITPSTISLDQLKKILYIQYKKFNDQGYFQKAFGYECVEDRGAKCDEGTSLDDKLLLDFKGRGESMIPTLENIMKLDKNSLFDLIEFLCNHVAMPTNTYYHEWDNCGLHVYDASYEKGKEQWRNELNESLSLL